MSYADVCESCGRIAENLTLIGNNWYCRNCLWDKFYDEDHALNYAIVNMDRFCEAYPEGYYKLMQLLKTGKDQGEIQVEEFVGDNLADYADWVIGNPVIITMQDIKRGKDNG